MLPTLAAGQLAVFDTRRPAEVGDIVAAIDPRTGNEIVKRLTQVEAGYWLEGDAHNARTAASSADSWVFGPVASLLGVMVWPRSRRH